jgi:hypothetical protein
MKQKSLVLVVALLALFCASLLMVRPAYACTCAPPTEEEAWSKADIVFSGRVTYAGPEPGTRYAYKLDVQTVWKGVVGPTVTFTGGKTSCDYEFGKGLTYLVYANYSPTSNDFIYTSLCSGTGRLTTAKLLSLGQRASPGILLLLLGVAVLTLALGVVVLVRLYNRRRREKAPMPN